MRTEFQLISLFINYFKNKIKQYFVRKCLDLICIQKKRESFVVLKPTTIQHYLSTKNGVSGASGCNFIKQICQQVGHQHGVSCVLQNIMVKLI